MVCRWFEVQSPTPHFSSFSKQSEKLGWNYKKWTDGEHGCFSETLCRKTNATQEIIQKGTGNSTTGKCNLQWVSMRTLMMSRWSESKLIWDREFLNNVMCQVRPEAGF